MTPWWNGTRSRRETSSHVGSSPPSSPREDALFLDQVPLPALSEYGFSLRYRGHWGIGIRRRSGQLEIKVPDSEESPIRVVLADRAVSIAPGETCTLVLPED